MDEMNENPTAHVGREFGHIVTRTNIEKKVVAGHGSDRNVQSLIASWMRSAIGYVESSLLRIARIADNMRHVAVTEGDKMEAQVEFADAVSKSDEETLTEGYDKEYKICWKAGDRD